MLEGDEARAAVAEADRRTTSRRDLSRQDGFYPRLIRLASNGAANGRLIASFDNDGTQSRIHESPDGGTTWKQIGTLTVPEGWHCCSGLFEMPVAMGATPKGALLWASTTRDAGSPTARARASVNSAASCGVRALRPAGSASLIVATAYMDEAQRFDWLMAMDDGKIIAHGTLQELLDKAGETTLDEAFIALLP